MSDTYSDRAVVAFPDGAEVAVIANLSLDEDGRGWGGNLMPDKQSEAPRFAIATRQLTLRCADGSSAEFLVTNTQLASTNTTIILVRGSGPAPF